MSDLIDRQAAIDAVRSYYDEQYALCDSIEELIEKLPSAERKKGHWVSTDDGWDGEYFVCSECGCPWTLIEGSPEDNGMNFCPNCGADMRGEKNDGVGSCG